MRAVNRQQLFEAYQFLGSRGFPAQARGHQGFDQSCGELEVDTADHGLQRFALGRGQRLDLGRNQRNRSENRRAGIEDTVGQIGPGALVPVDMLAEIGERQAQLRRPDQADIAVRDQLRISGRARRRYPQHENLS